MDQKATEVVVFSDRWLPWLLSRVVAAPQQAHLAAEFANVLNPRPTSPETWHVSDGFSSGPIGAHAEGREIASHRDTGRWTPRSPTGY